MNSKVKYLLSIITSFLGILGIMQISNSQSVNKFEIVIIVLFLFIINIYLLKNYKR